MCVLNINDSITYNVYREAFRSGMLHSSGKNETAGTYVTLEGNCGHNHHGLDSGSQFPYNYADYFIRNESVDPRPLSDRVLEALYPQGSVLNNSAVFMEKDLDSESIGYGRGKISKQNDVIGAAVSVLNDYDKGRQYPNREQPELMEIDMETEMMIEENGVSSIIGSTDDGNAQIQCESKNETEIVKRSRH